MGKRIDLVGQKFGRLTVQEDVGRRSGGVLWRCLCECGNPVDVRGNDLRYGNTQSCGCYNKKRTSEINKKTLTGEKFGRLVVLEDVGRKHGEVLWRCLCDCGNMVDVIGNSLQSGKTQSCGCLHKERTSKANSSEKSYRWKGGITLLNHVIRNCTRYKEWRTSIFHKDNFTCVHCGTRGGYLIAHHIIFFSTLMEEHNITTFEEAIQCKALWEVSNGITLCIECHEEEHARLRTLDIVEPM